jgi:hypothetical protein
MPKLRSRAFLTLRIDRCYLVAAGAKTAEKRQTHLERARHYRRMLGSLGDRPSASPAS